jgi:hypothetical protein
MAWNIIHFWEQDMRKIIPAGEVQKRVAEASLASLIARLRGQSVKKIVRWTRDDLYQDAQ